MKILSFKLILTLVLTLIFNIACSSPPKKESCFWECLPGQTVPDCKYLCIDNELLNELYLMEKGLRDEKIENQKEE